MMAQKTFARFNVPHQLHTAFNGEEALDLLLGRGGPQPARKAAEIGPGSVLRRGALLQGSGSLQAHQPSLAGFAFLCSHETRVYRRFGPGGAGPGQPA
nr:hypothetical protein [Tanacetum cinerariifolium]